MTLHGSALWTPDDILTTLWYDASDLSTIHTNASGVTQWDDKSGNGNHATQAVTNLQPSTAVTNINGLNLLTFDGVDDELAFARNGMRTNAFAVFVTYPDNDSEYSTLGNGAGTGGSTHWDRFGGNTIARHFSTGRLFQENLGVPSSGVIMLSYNADQSRPEYLAHLNGTQIKQYASSFTFQDFLDRIGKGYVNGGYLKGSVAEVVLLNRWASSSDREQLEGYLAHKWGIVDKLPVDHPYKELPPGYTPPGTLITLH